MNDATNYNNSQVSLNAAHSIRRSFLLLKLAFLQRATTKKDRR